MEMSQKTAKRSQQLRLKIQPQPPEYPFVNHPFEFNVYLVDDRDQLKCNEEVPLQIKLCYDERPANEIRRTDMLVIDSPQRPMIAKNGVATIRVRIMDVSMSLENRKFCIVVSAATDALPIVPAQTDGFTVIRHRLVIREPPSLPDIWYKDEGGRDKCLELKVHLIDANGGHVHDRRVQLAVLLLYEDNHEVLRQDILKVTPDSRIFIDETGTADIRFRIEDVSKNHQNQGFRICIGPNTKLAPINADISAAISTPVSVRSKRNKRQREKIFRMSEGAPPARVARGSFEAPVQSRPIMPPTTAEPSQLAAMMAEKSAAMIRDPQSLKDAVSNIINWSAAVVNGVQNIQWQHIGYPTKADNTPDYSKPQFAMPNPNAFIFGIIQMYTANVMGALHILAQEVDRRESGGSESDMVKLGPMPQQQPQMGGPVDYGEPPMIGPLMRQPSSLFLDPQMGRQMSMDLNFDWPAYPEHYFPHDGLSIESQVYYILAIMSRSDVIGDLGFPAFDKDRKLLGFYREGQLGNTTVVELLPINHPSLSRLTDKDTNSAVTTLEEEIRKNSRAVHMLAAWDNNLEKMKEDVILHSWQTLQSSSELQL